MVTYISAFINACVDMTCYIVGVGIMMTVVRQSSET